VRRSAALLLALLCWAPERVRGQEAQELRFTLGPSTLPEALATCADRYGIQYLAVGCTDRREELFIKAGCLEDLMDELLAAYGAAGVGLDGLWFVDARGCAEDRWAALQPFLPPGVAELPADQGDDRAGRQAIRTFLRNELHTRQSGCSPPGPAELLLIPFACPVEEAPTLQSQRLAETVASLRGVLGMEPSLEGSLSLDAHRSLWLTRGTSRHQIIQVPPDWGERWLAPIRDTKRPWLDTHFPPLAVQRAAATILAHPVHVQLTGHVQDVLLAVADQTEARVEWPPGATPLPVAIDLGPVPLWVLLTGLSLAGGTEIDLSGGSATCGVEAVHSTSRGVYGVSSPVQRACQRQFAEASHCLPVPMWGWLCLSDAQRAALEAGEAVEVVDLDCDQRQVWRTLLAQLGETLVHSLAQRLDAQAAAESVRGMFVVGAHTTLGAVRIRGGEIVFHDLRDPAAVREEGADGGGPPSREAVRRWSLTPAADRTRSPARWWSYGSREEVRAHTTVSRQGWVLVGDPSGEP